MLPQLLTAACGVWLTFAPSVLGYDGAARVLHLVAGPVIAALAIVASSDIVRALRWANAVAAALLAVLSLVPPFAALQPSVNGLLTAALVIGLAVKTPPSRGRYGGGWTAV